MTHDEATRHGPWDALGAAYALHALEPDEEAAFTEHLAGCAECTAQLREHELVAAQLGSLAHDDDEAAPPWATLRFGVLGADAIPRQVARPRSRHDRTLPQLLAAAAAVLVLSAGAAVGWQLTRPSESASSRAVAACEHQAGCAVVRLHAAHGGDAAAVLVSAGRMTVAPLRLDPPAADRMYVVWQLPRNGKPIAVNDFHVTAGTMTAALPTPYDETAAFAVSLEPTGPLPSQPTHVLAVGPTT